MLYLGFASTDCWKYTVPGKSFRPQGNVAGGPISYRVNYLVGLKDIDHVVDIHFSEPGLPASLRKGGGGNSDALEQLLMVRSREPHCTSLIGCYNTRCYLPSSP